MRLDQLSSEKWLFTWNRLRPILSSDLSRATVAIPIIGYLIIFNDTVFEAISFDKITSGHGTLVFDSKTRFQFLYFGLLVIALSTIWFRYRSPTAVRLASDTFEYQRIAFENFSTYDFVLIFFSLERTYGFGQFDDTQFDRDDLVRFLNVATKSTYNFREIEDDSIWFHMKYVEAHEKAISSSREFLIALLVANYEYSRHERHKEIVVLTTGTLLGLSLLLLPSIDVFVSIVVDLFSAKQA